MRKITMLLQGVDSLHIDAKKERGGAKIYSESTRRHKKMKFMANRTHVKKYRVLQQAEFQIIIIK